MSKIVVGLFDDIQDARMVVQDLKDAGFRTEDISLIASDTQGRYSDYLKDEGGEDISEGAGIGAVIGGLGGLLVGLGALAIPGVGPVLAAGPIISALAGAGIGAAAGGLLGALVDAGIPDEQAGYFAEGVKRGGTLVTLQASDQMANRAVDIMNRHNPVDVNKRASEWRSDRTMGEGMGTMASSSMDLDRDRMRDMDTRMDREIHTGEELDIPVVEEEMRVGKREVESGGVRIHTYTEEKPVEETVELRDEHVEVERRPVNRPASEADFDAFSEGTIEIDETHEEAVVDKRANVVEEVHVRKDVDTHEETIRDTLRRKDVEVEHLSGSDRTLYNYDEAYAEYEPMFRSHYDNAFTTSGYTYDDFVPAYRYGYTLANDDRFRNRTWSEIEMDARRDWERSNPDSAWDQFKDAVRHAWHEVTGRA